jgi:hypothetical protein
MSKKLVSFLFCAVLLFSFSAKAVVAELGLFYFSDVLASTNDAKYSRTIYDVAVLMTSEGKRLIGIGWNYAGVTSIDDNASGETKYTSTETGPKFTYMFGREQNWYASLTYNLLAKAKFSDTAGEAEWRGTSLKGEFGYMSKVASNFSIGVKLVYHQATYNEQITDSTTLTQESNTKTMIYPNFSMIYKF